MDWISRTVYIAAQEYDTEGSSILAYNIDQKSNTVMLTRDHKVQSVVVDPYTRWDNDEEMINSYKLSSINIIIITQI